MLKTSQKKLLEEYKSELTRFNLFSSCAQSLSFTDTAMHFYVSQPSISTAIKRLETEFNASLIDRRKTLKKIKLTPAGDILYKTTDEIINKLQKTKQQIEDIDRKSTRLNSSHV